MAVKRQSPNCGRSPSVLLEKPSDESSSPPPLRKAVAKKEKMSSIPRTRTPMTPMTRIGRGKRERSRFSQNLPRDLLIAIPTWYIVGVGSICTTNILMNEYSLPPLVLTFQQLAIGSTLLRLHLHLTGGLQPLPKDDKQKRQSIYFDFVLAGLFNALDFLATNTCFSHSSASFVETIKASEPLTTTAIALFFSIDTLSGLEAICIVVLVSGVFLSTMANASGSDHQGQADFHQSVKTTLVVMTANLCFALRAKSQKMFRTYPEGEKLDDENLLMRMEQIGALSMALPVIIFELPGILERGLNASFEKHCHYWALAVMNAACFCTYCLASCYVLTKLSVVQYTCFNCLRRIFAIIFMAIVFGVPISLLGGFGILLCFCGFLSFTYVRQQNSVQQRRMESRATPLPLSTPKGNKS